MSLIQRQTIIADLRTLPVGRTAADFLDYLTIEAGLSNNTILAYGRDLREFLGYCQAGGVTEIAGVSVHRVQMYLGEMARRDKSENSAKRALVAIRMFLRFAKLRGLIEDDGTRDPGESQDLAATADRVQQAAGAQAAPGSQSRGALLSEGQGPARIALRHRRAGQRGGGSQDYGPEPRHWVSAVSSARATRSGSSLSARWRLPRRWSTCGTCVPS